MGAIQFQAIDTLHTKKSLFNLSQEHTTTCDMGQLIPIMVQEAIPSDVWQMSMRMILRFAPLVAPILHPIYAKTYTFFVPNRLLYPKPRDPTELSDIDHNWENFITGGEDGTDDSVLPLWTNPNTALGSIWDYMGLPTQVASASIPTSSLPNKLPLRAYNLIYNEFFRDQNLTEWVDIDEDVLKYACWEKDYFTSALPFQQRGQLPAIPLSGLGGAEFEGDNTFFPNTVGIQTFAPTTPSYQNPFDVPTGTVGYPMMTTQQQAQMPDNANFASRMRAITVPVGDPAYSGVYFNLTGTGSGTGAIGYGRFGLVTNPDFKAWLNNNTINFDNVGGVDINIMRTAFQTQKWLERNARAGARYTEQLKARFGENAGDARLDRPEFLGGTKTPVIISEVLQTAQNPTTIGRQPSTQLGTMAGHGITADDSKIGTYRVKEHGWIITLLCVRPETSYSQGIDLKFTRRSRYDFLMPEFANLSEQAVHNREIYLSSDETYNETIFGYQGRYNEYRYSKNIISNLMKTDFSFWNLSRIFADTAKPTLNTSFVECRPDKRIFAVTSEPGIFLNYGAINNVVRCLPIIPEPGLIDHH